MKVRFKKAGWIVLLAMIGLSSVRAVEKPRPVEVMALSGITGLAMVQMIDRADRGQGSFRYTVLKSPDLLMGKVVTGEAQIAALPVNQAAILYNKGVSIGVPAIIGWGVMYLVGDDPAIRKWKDLRGKTVHLVAKGAVPDLLFRYLAGKNELNPDSDLRLDYSASPVEAAQLMAAGKVSLAALPEPWVAEVLNRSSRLKVLLNFQTEWSRLEQTRAAYPQTCIVVNRRLLAEQPRLVRDFMRELDRSIAWLNQNPEPAGGLAQKYLQIPAGAVRTGLKRCNIRYQPIRKVKAEVQHFLQRLGEVEPAAIGGKLPDEAFYSQP